MKEKNPDLKIAMQEFAELIYILLKEHGNIFKTLREIYYLW